MSYGDPNFTILTSGGCNAHCGFCTDSFNRKAHPDYMKNMEHVLFNMVPAHFDQISISGGEPTLSPNLGQILGLIKLSNKFRKVVLTTNGARLVERMELIARGINHLNVSRHAIGYEANTKVFGTKGIITDEELVTVNAYMNERGIDVNFNHVYDDNNYLTVDYVARYIVYAKAMGATSVSFRYDQNKNNLKETYLEKMYSRYVRVNEGTCPVCRNHTVLINGMPVVFKASYAEPSKAIDDVYELIYGIDGRLTTDWAGTNEFTADARDRYVAEFDPQKSHTVGQTKSSLDNGKKDPLVAIPSQEDIMRQINGKRQRIQEIQQATDRKLETKTITFGGGCGNGFMGGGGCGRS